MQKTKEQTPFLATTAIEEFWDPSKPLLFLGDWCLRYSRRSMWEKLQGEVVKATWSEGEKNYDAYNYISGIYEKVLASLSKGLNVIHGVNYSNRYWRIVIGAWLYHYIHMLYDRYMSISSVLKNYPKLTTYVLAKNNFIVPINTIDAIRRFQDDPYNLQAYTKILSVLGKDFPSKNYQQTKQQSVSPKISTKRLLLHKLIKQFYKKNKVILSSSYFNKYIELKIFLRTLGKVLPIYTSISSQPLLPVNSKMRTKLEDFLPDYDEFTKVLKRILPTDIPQSHLEAFKQITDQVHATYPVAPKAIVSAVSWFFDEPFKQWAAYSGENGTKLMGIQYGGDYGSLLFLAYEQHDLNITDKYYSWGWSRQDCVSKVFPMPATKLATRKLLGASKKREGILFVSTSVPRYVYRLPHWSNSQTFGYLQMQLKFIEKISPQMRNVLRFRVYQHDWGWDIRQRIEDTFPEVHIEDWQTSFLESLENSRLYVCDHLGTTFIEALSANKPTILFWDPAYYPLREEAKPYYEAIHSVGILHHSAHDAAKTINDVYDDIETWWNEPTRQFARKKFCNQFARTSSNAIGEWAFEFKKIANGF